jgi:hypothetical protein
VSHGLEHAAGHRVVHIVADEIHELERPHPEAPELTHGPVYGRHVGDAFLQDAKRLAVKRARHTIHDEPWRVGREHGGLPPAVHQLARPAHHSIVRRQGGHDLHQRQHRRGIEEVHSHHPPRRGARRSDRGNRQRGRVRGENAIRSHRCLQLAEDGLLGREVLHDGLDYHHAPAKAGQVVRALLEGHPRHDLARLLRGTPALLHVARQGAFDATACLLDGWRMRVRHDDLVTRRRGNLCDAGAHRSRA